MNRINPNRKLPLYTLHMVLLLFLFLPLHGLVKAGIGFLASLVRTEFVDVFW